MKYPVTWKLSYVQNLAQIQSVKKQLFKQNIKQLYKV
jgi:hypothetical protein